MKFSLVCGALLAAIAVTDAALPGSWPEVDKVPAPVPSWTAMVDQSKVPNAPVVKTVGKDCPAQDTYCNWSCSLCTRNETDIVECPQEKDWGISFDDGPTQFTSGLLDFLRQSNTKVTFFVIGSRVHDNPEILQQAVKDGHQIGGHTWSHPSLTTLTNEQLIAEFKWTELAIQKAVGLTPKYMRPPFGDFDDRVRGIASQLGYKMVIWDLDTNDWMSAEDKSFQLTWIEGNFTQWVKFKNSTGHISLEHDLYSQTAQRAQLAIPIVQNAGFNIKPVAACVGDDHPYAENVQVGGNGTAPPAAPASSGSEAPAPAAAAPASGSAAPAAAPKAAPKTDPKAAKAAPKAAPAAAAPAAAPASGPSYSGGNYLEGNASSPSPSPSPNSAASIKNSLNVFLISIIGALMFI